MKIGDIVFVTIEGPPQDPRSPIPKVDPTFPAIVHEVFPTNNEIANIPAFLGVTVFTKDGPRLMRKISYSNDKEIGTWRRTL